MNVFSLIALVGASQGFVLALMLATQPFGFRPTNLMLATFIGIFSTRLLVYFIIYSNQLATFPYGPLLLNLNFALGPLLYFYVRSLTMANFAWRTRDYLTFLPVPMAFAYSFYLVGSIPDLHATGNWWAGSAGTLRENIGMIYLLLSALYFTLFIVMAGRRLVRHQENIELYFSNTEGKQLRWLWVVLAGCLLISLSTVLEQMLRMYAGLSLGPRQSVGTILATLLLYYMAFMGMRQSLIFLPRQTTQGEQPVEEAIFEPEAVDDEPRRGKYEKSGLKEEDLSALWQKLEQVMQDKKPFTNIELKLADLAELVGISGSHLSQVLNRQGGQKFFDYINAYRVQEAARLLHEKPSLSLLHIALACGFSTQQAFSSRFKKVMHMTPSEYRQRGRNTPA